MASVASLRPLALVMALGLLLMAPPPASAGGGWEKVDVDEGVTVEVKEIEGRDLPVFRGRTVIGAGLFEIMAVLHDVNRGCEWMHQCAASRLLKEVSEEERILYHRTDAPWPVDDRDVVLRSSLAVDRVKQQIVAGFRSIRSPLMPPVDGVVRMPRLRGHYKMRVLGPRRTWVEYQIDADPGGMLPDWIIRATTRDIPVETLVNLKRQVRKALRAGQYADRIAGWRARAAEGKGPGAAAAPPGGGAAAAP